MSDAKLVWDQSFQRVVLNAKDFFEAFEEFISEAERIVKNEK